MWGLCADAPRHELVSGRACPTARIRAITPSPMSEVASENASTALPGEPPKGALFSIFLIILVDFIGFGIIIPLLPFYIPNYQEHAMQVTMLFSVYSICQFIGAPILGALSD